MFTKYGIDIPQNYSGNRFRRVNIYETETKTHRGPNAFGGSSVRTTVSPTFKEDLDKRMLMDTANDNITLTDDEELSTQGLVFPVTPYTRPTSDNTDTIIDATTDSTTEFTTEEKVTITEEVTTKKDEITDTDAGKTTFSSLLNEFKKSGIANILSKGKRDDLLIIALILLLASNGESNTDVILFLALLLLF